MFIAIMLLAGFSFGQVILTEEDYNQRVEGFDVMVPLQNINTDQYQQGLVPLGDGLLLLAALGGAYLLKGKTKEKRKY